MKTTTATMKAAGIELHPVEERCGHQQADRVGGQRDAVLTMKRITRTILMSGRSTAVTTHPG